MIQFTWGDAITFTTTFANSAGVAFDPSSTWGFVFDASSTVVNSFSSLTKVGTGAYTATWQSGSPANRGQVAFEACGLSGTLVYRRRAVLLDLI